MPYYIGVGIYSQLLAWCSVAVPFQKMQVAYASAQKYTFYRSWVLGKTITDEIFSNTSVSANAFSGQCTQ